MKNLEMRPPGLSGGLKADHSRPTETPCGDGAETGATRPQAQEHLRPGGAGAAGRPPPRTPPPRRRGAAHVSTLDRTVKEPGRVVLRPQFGTLCLGGPEPKVTPLLGAQPAALVQGWPSRAACADHRHGVCSSRQGPAASLGRSKNQLPPAQQWQARPWRRTEPSGTRCRAGVGSGCPVPSAPPHPLYVADGAGLARGLPTAWRGDRRSQVGLSGARAPEGQGPSSLELAGGGRSAGPARLRGRKLRPHAEAQSSPVVVQADFWGWLGAKDSTSRSPPPLAGGT